MPLLRGAGRPLEVGWRKVGRFSTGSAPANQAIAASVFANFETSGVAVAPLQTQQALLIKRYVCSIAEPTSANALFIAQTPIHTLQVSPFGLANAVLSWGAEVQGGVGVAGNPNFGQLSALGTIFVVENEWLDYDDYRDGLPIFTGVPSITKVPLKLFTDARVWNSSAAGQNVRFSESLLYEIWQGDFA